MPSILYGHHVVRQRDEGSQEKQPLEGCYQRIGIKDPAVWLSPLASNLGRNQRSSRRVSAKRAAGSDMEFIRHEVLIIGAARLGCGQPPRRVKHPKDLSP